MGVVGQAYTTAIPVNGTTSALDPATLSVSNPPAGITAFISGTAVILSGTPTAVGSYPMQLNLRDVGNCPVGTRTYVLGVTTCSPDEDSPVVTPPSPSFVTVNQTLCPGVTPGATLQTLQARYPSQAAAVEALVNGATASDYCSEVTQLTPLVRGKALTPFSMFEAGSNSVLVRFSDAVGNIGLSGVTVKVRRQGDVDESGAVDIFDVVSMAANIVGNIAIGTAPFTAPLESVDTDNNGVIDVFDLVILQSFVVGNVSCLTP